MKMNDEIKHYNKEYVYDKYTRIVTNFKDYNKISKTKMLEAIYNVYSDYNNIINICTSKELKYLKMILKDSKNDIVDVKETCKTTINYLDKKYEWEKNALRDKFLINYDFCDDTLTIPEEILNYVETALNNTNFKLKDKIDELNEQLVGYIKAQGSSILSVVAEIGSSITEVPEEVIFNHMLDDKLFNYYVFISNKDFESIGKNIPFAIHEDYFEIEEELEHQRSIQGLSGSKKIDLDFYKRLFYNDFDIKNPKINKFLKELKSLPFFWNSAIKLIKEYAMLNLERDSLKNIISSVPALKDYDLTYLFKLMDDAMDEMPSGALNGFTPNEAKEIKQKEKKKIQEKDKAYTQQQDACLDKHDAKLFYKIYFALLEFTNNKYKINKNIKLYNKTSINPYLIKDIVDKFWENKDTIVLEFCLGNPYKFNKEELKIKSEFKKGIRDMFIIVRYETNYTSFMTKDKIYMVKGINDNIDNIINYRDLPYIAITSIIPFKSTLIYDGMLLGTEIKLGNSFEDLVEKEYSKMMKYYHL